MALWLGFGLVLIASPDTRDTRLLSFPAISQSKIAFVYGEDLWVADLNGSNPRKITSDLGVESHPVFSPDGKWISFSGQYDGNTDVYLISSEGGIPRRLTWHPGPDLVRGWTPDGSRIVFTSNRHVFTSRHAQLFTVGVEGGMPEQLPIPHGFEASMSADGSKIAYCPHRDVTGQWKNYRGGTHSRIWIYNRADHQVVEIPQPAGRCNDLDPNWFNGTVLFRSDRDGEYNIYSFDPATKSVKKITQFSDFPVLDIATGGGNILFEQAGYLHRLDHSTGQTTRLQVGLATDAVEIRQRFAKGSKYVRGAGVSPSGARAVVEFRGEIVTVPAEKGDPRNLTNTPGAHERSPSWSPDGKWIGYFSDESGEYQLHLAPQDGKGQVRKIALKGSGFYQNLVFSPDSTKALFTDQSDALYLLDIATLNQTKITDSPYGRGRSLKNASWSPDSKWVVYSNDSAAKIGRIFVYSLEEGKSHPITDGLSEATEPVFDASGKYIHFASSTDTGMSKHGFMQSSADSQRPRFSLNLIVLRKDTPSPFLKESDEEKSEATRENASSRSTESAQEKPAEAGESGRRPNNGARNRPGREPVKLDLDGISQRILSYPLPPGSYANLQAGPAHQLFFLARSEGGGGRGGRGGEGGGPGAVLHRYDLERRKDDVIQPTVQAYLLTPDGRKMLYSTGNNSWQIGPATPGGAGPAPVPTQALGRGAGGRGASAGSGDGESRGLKLDSIEVLVDPAQEWRQIFTEAWRINRDYFYDPNMHGADWNAIRKKYEVFLPHVTNSADLYKVIKWMLSELSVGHSYHTIGERTIEKKTVPGGLLGADYEIANGRYRFKKIYGGLNWTTELRSPLTAPGAQVKEGEYLLAVRGMDVKPPKEIYSLFENTAGKSIEITVGPNPDGKDSRVITVEPIANEYAIRNLDWIEGNLRKVHKATNGRVAYVYVPDTAAQGLTYFKRYFFPQIDKEAIIIDERSNSGGWIADYYIDMVRKQPMSRWAPRYGADWRTPSAAIHGPSVMIIDEGAGSGGDMLPWMFRHFQMGPLVGKRTWGGLVGIGGYPALMDGGSVTAPNFAIWTKDGFIIENEGVPPDIDVDQWPADVIAGKDPQLDKAIEVILKELDKKPTKEDKRPAYPTRVKKP